MLPDFEDLANIWERYNVNFGLIDERPEEREARSFMNRFTGRVKLARWSGQGQHEEVTVDEDRGLLIARRSWACDQTVDHFRRQRKVLPSSVQPVRKVAVTSNTLPAPCGETRPT